MNRKPEEQQRRLNSKRWMNKNENHQKPFPILILTNFPKTNERFMHGHTSHVHSTLWLQLQTINLMRVVKRLHSCWELQPEFLSMLRLENCLDGLTFQRRDLLNCLSKLFNFWLSMFVLFSFPLFIFFFFRFSIFSI